MKCQKRAKNTSSFESIGDIETDKYRQPSFLRTRNLALKKVQAQSFIDTNLDIKDHSGCK